MIVEVWQLGGFAGIQHLLGSADTQGLPPAEAQRLLDLLARLAAWSRDHPEGPGADRFRYQVRASGPEAGPRTYEVLDEGDPEDPGAALVSAVLALVQRG